MVGICIACAFAPGLAERTFKAFQDGNPRPA